MTRKSKFILVKQPKEKFKASVVDVTDDENCNCLHRREDSRGKEA